MQFNNPTSTKMKTKCMTTLHLRKSISRSPLRVRFLLIPLVLAWLAISPQGRAVCRHGCDTGNSNTFLGNDALINNTTGHENTAIGNVALLSNTTGYANISVGSETLEFNTTGIENTAIGNVALLNNTTASFNTATGSSALCKYNWRF